jgi:hypothetical protein
MKDEKEYIWKVTVTDEVLIFNKVEKPSDYDQKATEQPYGELNGTYCGNRGYDDVQFSLIRKLKASNYYSGYCGSNSAYTDQWGNFSLRKWRESFGYAYAWEPSLFFKYNDELYCRGANFR